MTHKAEHGTITVEQQDGIATITLDGRSPLNAVDRFMSKDLREVTRHLEDERPRVAVLRGAGDTYCVGGDLTQTPDEFVETIDIAYDAILTMFESDIPYIASFKNAAVGGGLEFGVACDLRIAGENARIAVPEAGLGIIPAAGVIRFLAQLVGIGRARDMLLTGRHLSGSEAKQIGLVNRTTDANPDDLAQSVAETVSSHSTDAIAAMLRSLREAHRRPVTSEKWDMSLARELVNGEDFERGVEAFKHSEDIDFRK